MKMNYTKGKWAAKGGTVIATGSAWNTVVAKVPVGFMQIERIANARLISAAPELLEALIWLRNQIPNLQGEISLIGMQKVNEAIEKAS